MFLCGCCDLYPVDFFAGVCSNCDAEFSQMYPEDLQDDEE